MAGDTERTETLIRGGVDIEYTDQDNLTPLHYASFLGHLETTRRLLELGANVNHTDRGGTTALFVACGRGRWAVQRLLDDGAKRAVVQRLLDHGAEITRLLLDRDANIHHEDDEGFTALSWAAMGGFIHIAELLLDRGADLDHEDRRHGTTPLSLAVMSKQVEMVRFLLDRGANVNHPSTQYKSPLLLAVDEDNIEMAELLLDRGANIKQKNQHGNSPLLVAVCHRSYPMVRLLVDRGADINCQNKYRAWTPLICASYGGSSRMVRLLLNLGAKHDHPNNIGQTAMDCALACTVSGSKDVVYLLVQAAAERGDFTHITRTEAWRKSNSRVTEMYWMCSPIINIYSKWKRQINHLTKDCWPETKPRKSGISTP